MSCLEGILNGVRFQVDEVHGTEPFLAPECFTSTLLPGKTADLHKERKIAYSLLQD